MGTSRVSTARTEVLDMLRSDHQRAKHAFREFARLDPVQDAQQCRHLIEQTCAELQVHATLEEELFYPAVRGLIADTMRLDEAEIEHQVARALVEQLLFMSGSTAMHQAATFHVLADYVRAHIDEEEREIFPQLGRTQLDWQSLCDEMRARREELLAELLPQPREPLTLVAPELPPLRTQASVSNGP